MANKHSKRDWISHRYHEREQRDADKAVASFCRAHNITLRDLTRHPCWQDLVLLCHIHEAFAPQLRSSKTLKGVFDGYWGTVYTRKLRLKPKGLHQLESLTQACIKAQQQRQLEIEIIQRMRANATLQNKGHDMTAKGPNLPGSKLAKREQQGGREELTDDLPW